MIDTKELRRDADDAYVAHAPLEICGSELIELLDRLEAAEQTAQDYLRIDREKAQIAQRLEAAEKDVALKERLIDALGSTLNAVANECDALRAKIETMEKQEPVGCVGSLFDDFVIIHNNFDRAAPVYFAPGANCAPRITEG